MVTNTKKFSIVYWLRYRRLFPVLSLLVFDSVAAHDVFRCSGVSYETAKVILFSFKDVYRSVFLQFPVRWCNEGVIRSVWKKVCLVEELLRLTLVHGIKDLVCVYSDAFIVLNLESLPNICFTILFSFDDFKNFGSTWQSYFKSFTKHVINLQVWE